VGLVIQDRSVTSLPTCCRTHHLSPVGAPWQVQSATQPLRTRHKQTQACTPLEHPVVWCDEGPSAASQGRVWWTPRARLDHLLHDGQGCKWCQPFSLKPANTPPPLSRLPDRQRQVTAQQGGVESQPAGLVHFLSLAARSGGSVLHTAACQHPFPGPAFLTCIR
jgi:hypothetical protein